MSLLFKTNKSFFTDIFRCFHGINWCLTPFSFYIDEKTHAETTNNVAKNSIDLTEEQGFEP